jgi:hypothetical protein
MHEIREVVERSRRGQSDRPIALDLHCSRVTVRKYREAFTGLDTAAAEQQLREAAGQDGRPAQTVSSVTPYQAVVDALLERGVEIRTIFDRLRGDHGYGGSYASVRRFVAKRRPKTADVTVRVHTGPREEAIVYDQKRDLAVALAELRQLICRLHEFWEVPLDKLTILYSGSKGFHVEIPVTLLGGIEPVCDLPYRIGAFAAALIADLGLTCIDPTACEPLRLWRWPNSRHGTTGRHAIPLTATEALTITIAEIIALAAAPRTTVLPNDDDREVRPELAALWASTAGQAPQKRERTRTQRAHAKADGTFAWQSYDGPPAHVQPILAGCAWLRHTRDDAATLQEPDWYGMLTVVGRCEDGEQIAHAWSAPHPEYIPEDTADKLTRALTETGPATCVYIRNELEATACLTCPHWGRITSPIVLGHRRSQLDAAACQEEPAMVTATLNDDQANGEDDSWPPPPPDHEPPDAATSKAREALQPDRVRPARNTELGRGPPARTQLSRRPETSSAPEFRTGSRVMRVPIHRR